MTPKQMAIYALQAVKGDDLYRARSAFKNYTPEQMQEKYGASSKTCAEIIAGYEEHERQINEAIAWVEKQP